MEKQLSDSNSLNAASEFVHGLRHSFWVKNNKVCFLSLGHMFQNGRLSVACAHCSY